MLDVFEVLSLALTVSVLAFAFLTIKHWGVKPFLAAWRREELTATDWMIVGVTAAFVGAWWDNLYWGVAWVTAYLGLDAQAWWFEHGVVSNTFFRQGLGIVAGYCHYRAYLVAHPTLHGSRATAVLIGSMIAGLVFAGVLIAVKAFS